MAPIDELEFRKLEFRSGRRRDDGERRGSGIQSGAEGGGGGEGLLDAFTRQQICLRAGVYEGAECPYGSANMLGNFACL